MRRIKRRARARFCACLVSLGHSFSDADGAASERVAGRAAESACFRFRWVSDERRVMAALSFRASGFLHYTNVRKSGKPAILVAE
jgi:hypothetical protein